MHWRVAMSAAAALAALAGSAMGQQIKISQVYGGGGSSTATFRQDYVELFNAGAVPVNLSGMSIQYSAATSTVWTARELAGTVQPGGYFLIRIDETTLGLGDVPIPFDYLVPTDIAMAATNFKVALVNGTTALAGCPSGDPAVLDLVGFGTANCSEGGATAGVLSTTTAGFRTGGGCDDSGVNAADFTVGAPDPRNSISPTNPCPLPPGADLAVAFTSATGQVNPGGFADYSLEVRNFGPDLAPGVTLTVPVPSNATFIASNPPVAPMGGVLTFNLGDLALGGTLNVSLTLQADAGPTVPVSATVSGTAPDGVSGNNSAMASTLLYIQANAKLIAGVDTPTAPVVAVDVTSGAMETLWVGPMRALASDDANRRFFYSDGADLWMVPYDPPRTPVLVGGFSGSATTMSAGLAYDSIRNRLIGTNTSGNIYAIDPVTAVVTPLRDLGVGDLQGIDFDPVRDRIICTNDSTSMTAPMSGRGLYIIDPDPAGTEVTFVAGYPVKAGGTLDTDIDACAYGEGVIYPVADEERWFYRYSESSMSYLEPFRTPFGEDQLFSGATFTGELFNQSPGANLAVSISAPGTCSVGQGQTLTYSVTVHNFGPEPAGAGALTVPLPAGTTFQSSSPPLTPVGGELSFDITGLPSGADATLMVSATADVAGTVAMSASAASAAPDAFPSNNAAAASTEIGATPPSSATARGIFSSMPGSNEVPEFPGIFFDNVAMDRPVRSYSGNHWLMVANTTDAAAQDEVLLRGSGTSFSVEVQEGVTPVPGADLVGLFDVVYGINDSGDYVFGTNVGGADTTMDEVIVKNIAGTFTTVARESFPVPSVPGSVYGTTSNGATIQNDGTVSFQSSMDVGTTGDGWFTDDGNTLVAREGVTIPGNQGGGLTDIFRQLDSGSTSGQGIFFSADGARYCGRGFVGASDADDLVLVVDGDVVLQEGYVVPGSGFAAPISATGIAMNYMEPHGDWFAYGSNTDGQDWVVRNGSVLAARGDEIFPGAGLAWDDAAFAQGFFLATGNRFGDYVIGGLTNSGDTLSDAALVFNRSRIVLRENEPVDLDGNGVFDDDAYIHIFRDDLAWLGEDGYLYAAVQLRNGAGICSGSPSIVAQAFIRVRVFCPADWNRDGFTNSTDISAFLTTWLSSVQGGNVRADMNGDTSVNSSDISAFLTAWLAAVTGGC